MRKFQELVLGCALFVFLLLFWAYIGQPDNHIAWATSMPLASIYPTYILIQGPIPKISVGGAGKWHFLFWVLSSSKKNVCFFPPNENQLGFNMRYHLFLHFGWFLQNLGKYFIQTNMHMFCIFSGFRYFVCSQKVTGTQMGSIELNYCHFCLFWFFQKALTPLWPQERPLTAHYRTLLAKWLWDMKTYESPRKILIC